MMSHVNEYVNGQLKGQLTQTIIDVCEKAQTECPYSQNYYVFTQHTDREYYCTICGQRLFECGHKIASSCGWPSFNNAAIGSIELRHDASHGMERTEAVCSKCGSHLGHLFVGESGPETQRYCINAVALAWHDEDGSTRRFESEAMHQ